MRYVGGALATHAEAVVPRVLKNACHAVESTATRKSMLPKLRQGVCCQANLAIMFSLFLPVFLRQHCGVVFTRVRHIIIGKMCVLFVKRTISVFSVSGVGTGLRAETEPKLVNQRTSALASIGVGHIEACE